ncbi:MAG: T9SS type A sorting domain-containing protein [Saprospiraceae bacterium]|nr:T9SS type A sorting domain-containing protein [Saprospiraceae bacterium]
MKKSCFSILSLIICLPLWAQQVETVYIHPQLIDGMVVDSEGYIYTTPGAFNGQMTVGRATPDGTYEPDFFDGFHGPADIDQNAQGVFFVTNYDDNTLKSYDPFFDEVNTLASGLDGPAGVALDQDGNSFVSCYGTPSTFDGNQIIRVDATGTVEVWLESSLLFRPQGMTFDNQGNLWVTNTASGEIFKIDTTTKIPELIYQIGPQAGSLAFREKDGLLYFASQGNNQIYRMDLVGNMELFAGTGTQGTLDGEALSAQFKSPFGLAFSPTEDTLYVSGGGNLRRIINLDGTPSSLPNPGLSSRLVVSPNPFQNQILVRLTMPSTAPITLSIYNVEGKLVTQKTFQVNTPMVLDQLNILPPGKYFLQASINGKQLVSTALLKT